MRANHPPARAAFGASTRLLIGAALLSGCVGRIDRTATGDPAPTDAPDGGASDLGGAPNLFGEVNEPLGDGGSWPALLTDDDQITLTGRADVAVRRAALIRFLWGDAGPPVNALPVEVDQRFPNPVVSVAFSNLARVDRLVIDMGQGIKNETFHFVPKQSNGRLVIVQHGHAPTLDSDGIGTTIAALVANGYGVLGALMPCYNSFGCPIVVTDPGSPHNDFIAQIKPPSGDVLRYFVEHLVVSLHYLRTQGGADQFGPYGEFDMLGLSGGGWTTMLYAAIDPSITLSFPCSGGKPMYLRHCAMPSDGCIDGYDGDREQMYFPLYKGVAGYLDLYAMGSTGAGRRQVQEQIHHDGCCFGENQYTAENGVAGLTWPQAVRAYEQKIQSFLDSDTDQGWYRYEMDETASGTHVVSPNTLYQVILAELDGSRRPVAAASASDVFAKGPDGLLRHAPPAWVSTSVSLVGTPVVLDNPGGVDLFLRDPASLLIHVDAPNGAAWTSQAWASAIASDPAAARTEDTLHAVAVGSDARLWHFWKTGAGEIQAARIDALTPVVGTPSLLAFSADQMDVFVLRTDGGIQHVFVRGGPDWSSERAGAGSFRGYPTAAATLDGNLRVYARGDDDRLWETMRPFAGGAWSEASISVVAGAPDLTIAGSPSANIDLHSHEIFVMSRLPSGDLARYEIATVGGIRQWLFQLVPRPSGMAPQEGTAGFTLSPVALPAGTLALGFERGLWSDIFGHGWSWQGGVIH